MTTNCGRSLSRSLHRVGIAIAASGVLVTSGSHANPSDQIVLVSPKDLPELSRGNGEGKETVLDLHLDLHKETVPKLRCFEGLTWQGSMTPLGSDELSLTTQGTQTDQNRDDQVMEPWSSEQLSRLFDVKQVRAERTNAATCTTFLITESGSYVTRRPDAESKHQLVEITPN